MACQPAAEIGIFLAVTFDTLTHSPNFTRKPLEVLYLSVAFLAGDVAVNMPLMIEQHMFGHIVDFNPRRWRVGVKILVFLFYPGVLGNNILVTVQALFHRRHTGMIGISHIGMTVLALDLFDPAVDIMAERDRLSRSDASLRPRIEKENKGRDKQCGSQRG